MDNWSNMKMDTNINGQNENFETWKTKIKIIQTLGAKSVIYNVINQSSNLFMNFLN